MPNGCFRSYLKANSEAITSRQRLVWAKEAAEAVQLLHSANVIPCDVGPRNFLASADFSLRTAEFSGSSRDGSRASVCPGTRFTRPGFNGRGLPEVKDDIFSLGSTVYTLITGKEPFQDCDSDEVETRYATRSFPDVQGQPCDRVIEGCWMGTIPSAKEVVDLLTAELVTAEDKIPTRTPPPR